MPSNSSLEAVGQLQSIHILLHEPPGQLRHDELVVPDDMNCRHNFAYVQKTSDLQATRGEQPRKKTGKHHSTSTSFVKQPLPRKSWGRPDCYSCCVHPTTSALCAQPASPPLGPRTSSPYAGITSIQRQTLATSLVRIKAKPRQQACEPARAAARESAR